MRNVVHGCAYSKRIIQLPMFAHHNLTVQERRVRSQSLCYQHDMLTCRNWRHQLHRFLCIIFLKLRFYQLVNNVIMSISSDRFWPMQLKLNGIAFAWR